MENETTPHTDWTREEARHRFYNSSEWRRIRLIVMERDHWECQLCKARGIYTRAQCVHHVDHLEDNPDKRLDTDNLIALCNACHNALHPEKHSKVIGEYKPLTVERW